MKAEEKLKIPVRASEEVEVVLAAKESANEVVMMPPAQCISGSGLQLKNRTHRATDGPMTIRQYCPITRARTHFLQRILLARNVLLRARGRWIILKTNLFHLRDDTAVEEVRKCKVSQPQGEAVRVSECVVSQPQGEAMRLLLTV